MCNNGCVFEQLKDFGHDKSHRKTITWLEAPLPCLIIIPVSQNVPNTAAWKALNLLLPTRTPDEDYWRKESGPQLAALVEGAGYAPGKQYEALLFHYHWMVSCFT